MWPISCAKDHLTICRYGVIHGEHWRKTRRPLANCVELLCPKGASNHHPASILNRNVQVCHWSHRQLPIRTYEPCYFFGASVVVVYVHAWKLIFSVDFCTAKKSRN